MYWYHRPRRSRRRLKEADPDPTFQVAPMADLLLVLVVFFMSITASEFFHADRQVHLPEAQQGKSHPDRTDEVVINVGWVTGLRTGSIKWGDRLVSGPEALTPLLREQRRVDPAIKVLIRADKNVEYYYVASILKACREAEIPDVIFSVLNPPQQAKG